MSFSGRKNYLFGFVAILCGGLLSVFAMAADPSTVTVNALQWMNRSQGWCVSVPAGAAIDLWATAPATIPNNSRYVEILHADLASPAVPFCVRLGPATDTPLLTCDPVGAPATTSGFVASEGRFRTMEIPAPSVPPIPLWARSSAGNVTACVSVFW